MPYSEQETKYHFLDACANGNADIVAFYLEHGINPNCTDDREDLIYKGFNPIPALIIAILKQQKVIVELLLSHPQINVNICDGVFHRPAILFALAMANTQRVATIAKHTEFTITIEHFHLVNNAAARTQITIPTPLTEKLAIIEDQIKNSEYDMLPDVPEDGAPGVMYINGESPLIGNTTTLSTHNGDT